MIIKNLKCPYCKELLTEYYNYNLKIGFLCESDNCNYDNGTNYLILFEKSKIIKHKIILNYKNHLYSLYCDPTGLSIRDLKNKKIIIFLDGEYEFDYQDSIKSSTALLDRMLKLQTFT